jgi:hypothetical protein
VRAAPGDPELVVCARCLEVLDDLDRRSVARVLAYIWMRRVGVDVAEAG